MKLESGKVNNEQRVDKIYTMQDGSKHTESKLIDTNSGEIKEHKLDGQNITPLNPSSSTNIQISRGNIDLVTVKLLDEINQKLFIMNEQLKELAYYCSYLEEKKDG